MAESIADGLLHIAQILVGRHGQEAEKQADDHAEILQEVADGLIQSRLVVDDCPDDGTKQDCSRPANADEQRGENTDCSISA